MIFIHPVKQPMALRAEAYTLDLPAGRLLFDRQPASMSFLQSTITKLEHQLKVGDVHGACIDFAAGDRLYFFTTREIETLLDALTFVLGALQGPKVLEG